MTINDKSRVTERKEAIRQAPAYQEYASDILADMRYRKMSLAERGIWDTLRKECWVNKSLPADIDELSKLLRVPSQELESALTENVRSFFLISNDHIVCPELDKYREQLEIQRQKKSTGGKLGGEVTQQKRRKSEAMLEATLKDDLKPLRRDELIREVGSREEVNRVFNNVPTDEWVKNYDNASDAF